MRIGVPKEIKVHEYRVGMTPASVREAVEHGHEVFVEHDAAARQGITDKDYERAGAKVARHGRGGLRHGRPDRQGEGAAARRMRHAARRARRSSPTCISRPTPSRPRR